MTNPQNAPTTPYPVTAVWFGGEMIEVEILDRYECGGVQMAAVKAIEGAPFVGGILWPVRTPYTIVPLAQVYEISPAKAGEEFPY